MDDRGRLRKCSGLMGKMLWSQAQVPCSAGSSPRGKDKDKNCKEYQEPCPMTWSSGMGREALGHCQGRVVLPTMVST